MTIARLSSKHPNLLKDYSGDRVNKVSKNIKLSVLDSTLSPATGFAVMAEGMALSPDFLEACMRVNQQIIDLNMTGYFIALQVPETAHVPCSNRGGHGHC